MLAEGVKMIATGRSSIHLKKGMDLATEEVIKFLKENCVPVSSAEDIINVGTISANGDRSIGELLAKAIDKVGHDGIITIEPAKSVQTSLEVVEGMQLDTGFVSPFFITNSEKATCELENPYVVLTPNKIGSIQDILTVLESVVRKSRSLLIIADDVEGEALHTLIVNKTKGVMKVCAVKAPSYGEYRADILSDIQVLTGGTVFGATTDVSLKNADVQHLGVAKKVIVNRNSTTIIGDTTEERKTLLKERVENLRSQLTNDKTMDALHVDKHRKRLARLSGGIAVIRVGGSTEVEILEKKDRVEDAVNATLAATQEGIVPGGGTALFYAAHHLRDLIALGKFKDHNQDVLAGIEMIANVCEKPLDTIVQNTGISSEVVKTQLKQNIGSHKTFFIDVGNVAPEEVASFIADFKKKMDNQGKEASLSSSKFKNGYNAASGKYTNLVQEGIIDPVKVTRYALEHACSVVGLMLTCNAVIVNEDF
jgi:chaperonin GroEL